MRSTKFRLTTVESFLRDRGEDFTDEQIKELRKLLYLVAEVAIDDLKHRNGSDKPELVEKISFLPFCSQH